MGLTRQACGISVFRDLADIKVSSGELVVALAGNPNTGKSTLFNALTGLNQHTGNWPGKTVLRAEGSYIHQGIKYILVDLPGSYSLMANSIDEKVARNFICFGRPDATVVVADATCLERNLNLVLQVMEITSKVVLCVNLIDEAERKKIQVDIAGLSGELGIPVVATAARNGRGLRELLNTIHDVARSTNSVLPRLVKYDLEIEQAIEKLKTTAAQLFPEWLNPRWVALRLLDGDPEIARILEEFNSDNSDEHVAGRKVTACTQQIIL